MDALVEAFMRAFFFGPLMKEVYESMLVKIDDILVIVTTPTEIPFAADLTLYFTLVSITVVVIIRICIGIKDGLLANGSNTEMSVGEYVFKTCFSLAAVATAGPLAMWIISRTSKICADMMSYSFGGPGSAMGLIEYIEAGDLADTIFAPIALTISAILVICVIFQIGKRWVLMFLGSCVAPVIAIYAAVTDSSNYSGLIKEIAALGIINGLQILLLHFSLSLLNGGAFASSVSPFFWFFALGATLAIPFFLQRYALPSGGGGGGRTGVYIAMAGFRSLAGIRGAAK